jgi:hypothetical protein
VTDALELLADVQFGSVAYRSNLHGER